MQPVGFCQANLGTGGLSCCHAKLQPTASFLEGRPHAGPLSSPSSIWSGQHFGPGCYEGKKLPNVLEAGHTKDNRYLPLVRHSGQVKVPNAACWHPTLNGTFQPDQTRPDLP
ncbi:hypothetical protein VFPPC_16653 [Pochonia chlamydosporia 170]|uniref:Uncharacterized protein n=1 Tax=Pochonia chlamydosporia 170 TaxID=1380566 RepID=A0A179FAB2_METCM|nr:hypothetical protein VFPPC_16653 [Pochonia chlamydosporia 170]OAQ62404.1 hypothetical protein VFPPC_16653 [Pochonia chlamydosporia 170]